MTPFISYFVVGVLLAISMVSSCSETAFLSVSKARLHQRARMGHRKAIVALKLVESPERMLTTILLINTLVNTASSSIITALLVNKFGEVGVVYATIAISVVLLVFAEALPKTFGSRFAESITLNLAPLFTQLVTVCMPAVWLVKGLNRGILAVLGLHKHQESGFTENDLRGAINLGVQHGTIAATEQRMLDAILDLDDLTVADVMIHRSAIVALDIATDPKDIPEALGRMKHSRIPVYEGQPDNIIGIIYVRDYLSALAAVPNRHKVILRNHLRQPMYVPETTPVGHQLFTFLKDHQHLAMVVDEYGDIQGMIALEDILEEIVGDMPHSSEALEDATGPDGSIVLPARMPVRDANRRYGWSLPDDNAVTLAGLMIDQLHHLPAQGESVKVAGFTLNVTNKRGHRVEKIRITPPAVVAQPSNS
ncbi:MAG: CNNM domain-containing protein [Alphaproteobacteria bacterium]